MQHDTNKLSIFIFLQQQETLLAENTKTLWLFGYNVRIFCLQVLLVRSIYCNI